MSEEKCVDKMAYVRVSHRNIERIKAVGKKGETFDDVVTIHLDYYKDLHLQDWVNTRSNWKKQEENQADEYRLF